MTITPNAVVAFAVALAAASILFVLLAATALAAVARAARHRTERDEVRAQLAIARTKLNAAGRHVYLPPVSPVRRVHQADALTHVINGRFR